MAMKRKYPVGIQSFESIRKDGYLYLDKTPLFSLSTNCHEFNLNYSKIYL